MKQHRDDDRCVINKLELYPVAEVKRRLKVNDAGLRSMRRQGLPVIRVGRRAYYSGEHLIDFLMEKAQYGNVQDKSR